jgi:cytidylate kinase
MDKQLSQGLGGFVHLVERQMLLHQERSKLTRQHVVDESTGPYRFITISRDIGALGDAVASELATRLQWKVYDKEIVDYIARHRHVRHTLVDQLDEKTQSHIHDSVERLLLMFQGQTFSNDEYHIALIQALAALAAQGSCILLGHGGAYALRERPGLHVRITASFPVRVRRLSKRWGMSLEETRRIVQRTDQERKEFVQHHFKPTRDDLSVFHLVFNTDGFTVEYVVAAILGIIERSKQHDQVLPAPGLDSFAFQNSEQLPG